MADAKIMNVGENTPEHVAFKLLEIIASNEGKRLTTNMAGSATAERKWLLDTYAECLIAVAIPLRRLKDA
ncbi:hypothetical protein [Phenylobacterium sp.]|uniref:hypothetical protein n=1 Tax=Phenylobacterium sp. TaxID=1871053 RepID=UPI0011F84BD3|nr:hypothetical protein [Phenylobacterium sp.]THD61070.1 MAG: hypothetical protein E8A49_12455 [Phenylobacterium sp.]